MPSANEKEFERTKRKLLFWPAFLRLSRSYRFARAYRGGVVAYEVCLKEVDDFDKVLKTYEEFGDVWGNPLYWFEDNIQALRGAFTGTVEPEIVSILSSDKIEKKDDLKRELNQFIDKGWVDNGAEPSIVISIPLSAKKNNLQNFLETALEQLRSTQSCVEATPKVRKKFEITDQKIRLDALEKAYNLVMMLAADPEMPNWQVAQHLNLCPRSVEMIKNEIKGIPNTYDYLDVKNQNVKKGDIPPENPHATVNSVVWRYKQMAYELAENAARGEFPKVSRTVATGQTKQEKTVVQKSKKREQIKFSIEVPLVVSYLRSQLKNKGFPHQYAKEFLCPELKINFKREDLNKSWR